MTHQSNVKVSSSRFSLQLANDRTKVVFSSLSDSLKVHRSLCVNVALMFTQFTLCG